MSIYDAEIVYDTDRGNGYTFKQVTDMSDSVKEAIWFSSLPTGSTWHLPKFRNAKIVKTFRADNLYGISYIRVTSQVDESGRTGILNAQIKLLKEQEYLTWLTHEYKNTKRPSIFRKLIIGLHSLLHRVSDNSDRKIVIYSPFIQQDNIELNKSLLISICIGENILDKNVINPFEKKTFTSLALSPADESPMMCIPEEEIPNQKDEHINIHLSNLLPKKIKNI